MVVTMPTSVLLTGTFTTRGRPVQGLVRCTPERLWVLDSMVPWACLAPDVMLNIDGYFEARLTATDNDSVPFHYLVETPAGTFRMELPWQREPYNLKELIDGHRAAAWSSDRRRAL